MNRQMNPFKKSFGILLTVLMVSIFAFSSGVLAASGNTEMVRLRIQDANDNVRIEMPLPAFEYILAHSKDDCHVGQVDGKKINFKSEDLLKILKGKDVRKGEVKFLSVNDSEDGPTHFYVQVISKEVSHGAKKPTKVVLSVKDKKGEDDVRLSFSIETVNDFVNGSSIFSDKDDDFGPIIKTCLANAKDMGPGPIISIKTDDGEEVIFSLE